MILLLCQKTFPLLPQHPLEPPGCKKFNIHPKKNYVEFDFRRGTVLVVVSFL